MLFSKPTPKGTGLEIWGDFNDLRCLYDVMTYLAKPSSSENTPEYERNDRLLTIVPYEVRHAFQGQRLKRNNVDNGYDGLKTTYYGFRVDWITIIYTLSALRYNSGHEPTDSFVQGWLYLLENNIKEAMNMYDANGSKMLELIIERGVDVSTKYVYLMHQHTLSYYLSMKPTKSRFRSIPALLTDRNKAKTIISSIDKYIKGYDCSISEIESADDIPNPIIW